MCGVTLRSGSAVAGAIELSHLELVDTLINALQGVGHAPAPTISLPRFIGRPQSPSDPTIDEWLSDSDGFMRKCGVSEGERAVVLVDYLGGCANDEVLCHPDDVRRVVGALVSLLRRVFGPWETVTSLYAVFYSWMQSMGETLAEYSRALIRLHRRIEGAAPTVAERQALPVLGHDALKHQFVVGVRGEWVRHELRRLMLRSADRPFIVLREEALCLMCEEEASVVELRPVENGASGLSGHVRGSMSCVLSLDAVVLGDGGVSSGAVGRHVSVGDVSVSCGCDMELSVIDTVMSDAVSGGLCDLDSVSGGGDTDVSGVDTAVSDACDIDSMSRGDIVVCVGEMSLSGDGDAVVLGVDEYVCCVNPVLADGILNLCGIDTVVSGVDEPVCGVSSVMTAGELDMCACDRLVYDEAGDSRGVDVVDDVVACADDTLLPDAFRVDGWLSVVGIGVAQPG